MNDNKNIDPELSVAETKSYTINSKNVSEQIGLRTALAHRDTYYKVSSEMELQNYANNKKWPLEICPKCKIDLKIERPIVINLVSFLLIFANLFLSTIPPTIATRLLQTIINRPDILDISSILIYIFSVVYIFYYTRPKFYICSNCHCLLYHNKYADRLIKEFDNRYKRMFGA